MTVDFPHEVEVPPQSCTAGQVAHISYHCKACDFLFKSLLIVLEFTEVFKINVLLF